MSGRIAFLYAVSQIHAGKGSDVGVVDLPIQRERHTDFPVISGIKGAIRNEVDFGDKETKIFGNDFGKNDDSNQAGSVAFSEAKILFFPVRSIERGFVWLTSRLLLSRLRVAFEMIENDDIADKLVFLEKIDNEKAYSTFNANKVGLEEYEIEVEQSDDLKKFVSCLEKIFPDKLLFDKFLGNLILLNDDQFKFFIRNSTEILPRIAIDPETGVTKTGSLWYEEFLPQDTVMYFVVKELRNKEKGLLEIVERKLDKQFIDVGGNTSIGKGFSYITLK